MSIYVIGYYDHNNSGDEQYKYTFEFLFRSLGLSRIRFIDCDIIHDMLFYEDDIIILGGGDVLCDYFIDKITERFTGLPNKIIALSVGMPYQSILLETNKLDILDYIYLRSFQDVDLFKKFYNKNKIRYVPDLSFLLNTVGSYKPTLFENTKKIVAISLCSSYDNRNIIAQFISVIAQDYNVLLVPFNTNLVNLRENDYIWSEDLLKEYKLTDNVYLLPKLDTLDLFNLYKNVYICLSMRFHGCMYALHNKVPYISLLRSKKILNLNLDTSWRFGVSKDNFDLQELYNLFYSIHYNMDSLKKNMYVFNKDNMSFNNLCCTIKQDMDSQKDYSPVAHESESQKEITLQTPKQKLINSIVLKIETYVSEQQSNKNFKVSAIDSVDFSCVQDPIIQQNIVKFISFKTTNSLESKYNYGLLIKMFKPGYKLSEELSWLIDDFHANTTSSDVMLTNSNGLFNMTYKPHKKTNNVHRSGWAYIYDSLLPSNNINSDTLLDLSVDESFHWNCELYRLLDIVPYTKKWYGFVHHTFDTTFSEYNCENLIRNKYFLESLKKCKGLFVLSDYLRKQFVSRFDQMSIDVPVYTIYHPTEDTDVKFSYKAFKENNSKKIINVGTWLRNIYYFYNVKFVLTENSWFLKNKTTEFKKIILSGAYKNNYIPNQHLVNGIKDVLICQQNIEISNHTHCSHNRKNEERPGDQPSNRNNLVNNWYIEFMNHINSYINTVEIIDFVENSEYDLLLSKNIIFIRLVDASAVNTVIECAVRNTPIIVNKHPAVVEILGASYPLYYDDLSNTIKINKCQIKRAHQYLLLLDKSKLKINTFLNNVYKVIYHDV